MNIEFYLLRVETNNSVFTFIKSFSSRKEALDYAKSMAGLHFIIQEVNYF